MDPTQRRALQRPEPDVSAVMLAALNGDTAGVLALVEHLDVNARDVFGRTALFVAAQHGHTETVRALTARGADARAADCGGRTPVWAAANSGFLQTVRALVRDCGADAGAADDGGQTPVCAAAESGHAPCVRALVREFGVDVSAVDNEGATPVWAAAQSGQTGCVRALVECGANVDTANKNGATPVWIAAYEGSTDVLRALVTEFAADVHTADNHGATPVWIAAFRGRTDCVRALVQDLNAGINTANKKGVTPVLAAVRRLYTETARVLVECGADPWAADSDGWCALEVAAEAGATGLLYTMLYKSGVKGRRLQPRAHRTVDGDASALRVLAAVALSAGHAETAAMLQWLDGLENANPEHKKANDAIRRGGFPCPICFEEKDDLLELVPCGHRVGRDCWKRLSRQGGGCPICRRSVWHAAQPNSFPHEAPLYTRFCVRL